MQDLRRSGKPSMHALQQRRCCRPHLGLQDGTVLPNIVCYAPGPASRCLGCDTHSRAMNVKFLLGHLFLNS